MPHETHLRHQLQRLLALNLGSRRAVGRSGHADGQMVPRAERPPMTWPQHPARELVRFLHVTARLTMAAEGMEEPREIVLRREGVRMLRPELLDSALVRRRHLLVRLLKLGNATCRVLLL